MPRAALASLGVLLLAAAAVASDPHLDPTLLPRGCPACHESHGASRSPMLPSSQMQVCLSCHESQAAASMMIQRGLLSASASPTFLGTSMSLPFRHPMDNQLFTARQNGVTCSSCHAAHRAMPGAVVQPGESKFSPRSPNRFEHQLCLDCHGSVGPAAAVSVDISTLLDPRNPSYHPVRAPAGATSPSVVAELASKQINCTDCHADDGRGRPRGPHGSTVPFVLRSAYETVDGSSGPAAYSLCLGCHDLDVLYDEDRSFPAHRKHIEGEGTSCATCHDAHGSPLNRALIRFGDGLPTPGVAPSPSNGRLEFLSTSPGSGSCSLICHGEDHGPETYGDLAPLPTARDGATSFFGVTPPSPTASPDTVQRPSRPPTRRRIQRPPPRP